MKKPFAFWYEPHYNNNSTSSGRSTADPYRQCPGSHTLIPEEHMAAGTSKTAVRPYVLPAYYNKYLSWLQWQILCDFSRIICRTTIIISIIFWLECVWKCFASVFYSSLSSLQFSASTHIIIAYEFPEKMHTISCRTHLRFTNQITNNVFNHTGQKLPEGPWLLNVANSAICISCKKPLIQSENN